MADPQIMASLADIVETLFDEYDGPVTEATNASDVEQWDSMANVQFAVLVEQTFKVRFTVDEIGRMDNLGAVADAVARKRG